MESTQLKYNVSLSLFFFCIAAALGLLMRAAFVVDLPEWIDYRNIRHTHSHVALLGWLFGIFFLAIIYIRNLDFSRYKTLYWLLQASVLGMLLTFPWLGYGSFSIFFLAIHIGLSYFFAFRLWRDLNKSKEKTLDILFLKSSLLFLVLSTLGTWALGPLSAMKMKGTAIYYAAIQFYLHFQFNGWFLFAMIGILLSLIRLHKIQLNIPTGQKFYRILVIATLCTYALSVTWSTPYFGIFMINSLGVILQLVALYLFIKLLNPHLTSIRQALPEKSLRFLTYALIALLIKTIIQTVVVIPAMAEVSYTIRNFVVGFIHLLMLGALSLFAISIISYKLKNSISPIGTWLFIIGFCLSETLLFGQGFMLWLNLGYLPSYHLALFVSSAIMFLGTVFWALSVFRKNTLLEDSIKDAHEMQ